MPAGTALADQGWRDHSRVPIQAAADTAPWLATTMENAAVDAPADEPLTRLRLNPNNVAHVLDALTTRSAPIPYFPEANRPEACVVGGRPGELVAEAFRAEAVTIGWAIFGPSERLTGAVLRYELAHVARAPRCVAGCTFVPR